MNERLHHVGLVVADLDRSVEFYAGLVGLALLSSGRESDPRYAEMLGAGRVSFRWAELDLGGGHLLELLEYEDESAPAAAAHDPDGAADAPEARGQSAAAPRARAGAVAAPGSAHLAVRVGDIDGIHESLMREAATVLSRPIVLEEDNHWLGSRVFYALDPDGAMIEFVEEPGAKTTGPAEEAT